MTSSTPSPPDLARRLETPPPGLPGRVSLLRLYLLRALYALVVVGLGVVVWPGVFEQATHPWGLWEGLETSMLLAFSLLCALGLRYPLQMLPVLLWELLWKTIWLVLVAWPLWRAGRLDGPAAAIAAQVVWVVIVPLVIPWRHVFEHYVRRAGDRWR